MRQQSPSATACLIAASLYALARDPLTSHLVPAAAAGFSAHAVRQCSGKLFALTQALTWPVARSLQTILERLTVPGIRLHYALRKRYLEAAVRAALAEDFRRLVVLGAGFDTLAVRLSAEYPSLQCIEIDHPATQSRKIRTAAERDLLRPNLLFHASDLAARDSAVPGCRLNQLTIFVAEGLLMYLTADHTASAIATAKVDFRRLIDRAIACDGSYYLTYHHWATREQVSTCYPQLPQFLQHKRRYDPAEVFQSDWYRQIVSSEQ